MRQEWKKLDDECLLVSRTNFRHQGNETDELYKFNRDSTPDEYSVVWENWDTFKKVEERKKRMAKNSEIRWTQNKDGVWELIRACSNSNITAHIFGLTTTTEIGATFLVANGPVFTRNT